MYVGDVFLAAICVLLHMCQNNIFGFLMFNLANKLTLLRILITPLIIVLLYFEGPVACLFATLAFVAASLTDWADGYIARRYNLITSFGKFLDPLADKVLVCSILIMFAELHWVPAWLTILIICRELVVTGLRAMAIDEGIVLAADNYGKAKTVLQVLALGALILHYPTLGFNPQPIGMFLLYISVVLAVFSGINYVYGFIKQVQKKEL